MFTTKNFISSATGVIVLAPSEDL